MLDFVQYLRQIITAVVAKSTRWWHNFDWMSKIYMCFTQIFKVEDDETRRSFFALLCFLRAQQQDSSIPLPKGEEAQVQRERIIREADEVDDFFLNHCLVWSREFLKVEDEIRGRDCQMPPEARTNEIKQVLERDSLMWTKKCQPGKQKLFVYWNTAAAWRELWEIYNSSTTKCPRAPIRCIHRQNFGLLSHLLRQAHAETRRSCVLAVSHRLPTELVDIVYEFTLRAEGVPIDSTTWSEVEVIHPESEDEDEHSESEDEDEYPESEDDYHYKPSGDLIRKRIHPAYQCPAMSKTVLRHNLWKYSSTEVLQTEMF